MAPNTSTPVREEEDVPAGSVDCSADLLLDIEKYDDGSENTVWDLRGGKCVKIKDSKF